MAEWKTAGKVRMTPKGEYDSTVPYNILDVVRNSTGDITYVAKQDVPAGTALSNTDYWEVIVSADGAVKYDTAQSLTAVQKEQARENIDAPATGDIDALRTLVQTLCPAVTVGPAAVESVSDAVALAPDALTVAVTPVQDLHGYDAPWPGGAAPGILYSKEVSLTEPEITLPLTLASGTYTLWVQAISTNPEPDAIYQVEAYLSASGYTEVALDVDSSAPVTGRGTASGAISGIVLEGGIAGHEYPPTVRVMVLSGDVAMANIPPWENICPITGWTGANVLHGSFPADVTWTEGKVIDANGAVVDSSIGGAYSSLIPLETGQYVHLYGVTTAQGRILRVHGYNSSGEWVRQLANSTKAQIGQYFVTLDITSDIKYIRITTGRFSSYNPIIIGTKAPFSWQTEAGMVYGGTLDVLTGTLTVDRVKVTLTGAEASAVISWDTYAVKVPDIIVNSNSGVQLTHCSHTNDLISGSAMSASQGSGHDIAACVSGGPRVRFRNRSLSDTTLEGYKAYLAAELEAGHPVEVIAKCAQDGIATYQLTPAQITMLAGSNTLWADCGDTTLTYRANPYDKLLALIRSYHPDTTVQSVSPLMMSIPNTSNNSTEEDIPTEDEEE